MMLEIEGMMAVRVASVYLIVNEFPPPLRLPLLIRMDLLEVTENQNSNIKNDPSIVAKLRNTSFAHLHGVVFFCVH